MTDVTHDHLFPRFHVRPPIGFVNDPNGPIIIGDELHLYFQYRSETSTEGPVRWGHVTSRDYVRWVQHPPAIAPRPDGLDADGCWSGNTVIDDRGKIVAFYSAYDARRRYQSVVRAVSDDGGYHFGPCSLVIDDPADIEDVAHFRDPFVWRHGEVWRMVVGSGTQSKTASARVYESTDLSSWQHAGTLAALRRQTFAGDDTGSMWECPQVATLDGRDVLIVSPWSPGTELARVLTLNGFQKGASLTVGRLDHGTNFYAASVLRESPFGSLVWGWATEARSAEWSAAADWSGMLTLPRRLALRADGTVSSHPLQAMASLREKMLATDRDSAGHLRCRALPAQAELRLVMPVREPRRRATLRIRFSAVEHLDITVDIDAGSVIVDRSSASIDPRARRDGAFITEPLSRRSGPLALTGYIDGSILELFTDSGHCATVRMYPTTPPPWSLHLEGTMPRDELQCWPLRPAFT